MVAPKLVDDVEVKRVMLHHKMVRIVLGMNTIRPVRVSGGSSLRSMMKELSEVKSIHMRKLVAARTSIRHWSQRFVDLLTDKGLLVQRGNVRVITYEATVGRSNLLHLFEPGRILDVMFARGIRLENAQLEPSFYRFLVGENPRLVDIEETLPKEFGILKKALTGIADEDGIAWIEKSLSSAEREFLAQFTADTLAERAEVLSWFLVLGRARAGYEAIKQGFWQVIPVSLGRRSLFQEFRVKSGGYTLVPLKDEILISSAEMSLLLR